MNVSLYLPFFSPLRALLPILVVVVGLYQQWEILLRAEGVAGLMITLLAGYSLYSSRSNDLDRYERFCSWATLLVLTLPALLVVTFGGAGLDLETVWSLSLFTFFGIAFSALRQGKAALKAIFMLLVIFILVPSMQDLESILSYPMRRLSALIVYLSLSGIDPNLVLNGTELGFTSMRINITEACDGLNLMQNLIWIIWLNGLLLGRNWVHQLICFALKTPLVLLVNTGRIFFLTALVWLEGPEVLAGSWHIYSGWTAVVVAALIYFYLDKKLADKP